VALSAGGTSKLVAFRVTCPSVDQWYRSDTPLA